MAWNENREQLSVLGQRIRDRWIDLNSDDIDYIDGRRDRLVERLASRYRMTREQARAQVAKWETGLTLPGHDTIR
jgi:hypothetical protein